MSEKVTAYVSTRNRYYSSLPPMITSVALQTRPPEKFWIFDDGEQKDLRQDSVYENLFKLLECRGIEWKVFFGDRKGQVLNHQKALEWADTEWIWRLDDDNIADPNVLETLLKQVEDDKDKKIGAVASLVWMPGITGYYKPPFVSGKIEDINKPNLQWCNFDGNIEAEHLHNTFLYRKEAGKHGYCMELSPVGHREESLFSYGIIRNGYKIIVNGDCITWHCRQGTGGIRTSEIHREENFKHDELIFQTKMKEMGIDLAPFFVVILDSGLGDHLAFKHILPDLKKKHPKILIGCCYPEVFKYDTDIEITSIVEAGLLDNPEKHQIYKWMWDRNWKKTLVEAYREMYGLENLALP